jgi:tetratricopeptide (TPR) repeat protein
MSTAAAQRATFNEAIGLVGKGQVDRAEEICRNVLADDPQNVNHLALLGAIQIKRKRFKDAEQWLGRAIDLAPTFAKPHEDLGIVLLQQNRLEEALPVLQKATRLDPSLELAWLNLGKVLAMLGRGKEADEAFEKSFKLNPERKKLAHAAEHQKAGRLEQAEQLYKEVLRDNPNNVDALRMLGIIAYGSSNIDEAERLFRRAVKLAPDYVNAIIDLGNTLKEQNRYEEAIECFRQAIKLEPTSVKAHYLLASTLSPAALTYQAIESYERVLQLRPKHAGAKLGLGHMLKTVGRQEDAVRAYRDCIELKPDKGETYWSLANLKTYKLTDDDIREMESWVEKGGLNDESHVNFLFALAKAHEDRGEFECAWEYYSKGNATRRMLEHYDPVGTEVQNDAIIEVFSSKFVERSTGLGNPDNSPIFIVGLPRSGSTLIEQVLASHSMVEGTSELPYVQQVARTLDRNRADGINYPQALLELEEKHFKALGKDYLDRARMHRTEGKPHFIDKMPNNFPSVGFIHLMLPNAKIIDARRYPLDSCLSCYRQLFGKGQPFTYDLTDIGEYFLQYQRLMDHWHDILPGRVLTVQYEDVVTDFEAQIRRLLDYCELPWEDACLRYHDTDRPVRTASSEQVRQPIYLKSVHFWRNHEKHLGELIDVLNPVLNRYQQYESINR